MELKKFQLKEDGLIFMKVRIFYLKKLMKYSYCEEGRNGYRPIDQAE